MVLGLYRLTSVLSYQKKPEDLNLHESLFSFVKTSRKLQAGFGATAVVLDLIGFFQYNVKFHILFLSLN